MFFSSLSGSQRLSHMKRSSGIGVFTGVIGSSVTPRENNGVAQVSRYHGVSEWSTNNKTVSMLILAHCYGTYVPEIRETQPITAAPDFAVGLGIYYGATQVSGMQHLPSIFCLTVLQWHPPRRGLVSGLEIRERSAGL